MPFVAFRGSSRSDLEQCFPHLLWGSWAGSGSPLKCLEMLFSRSPNSIKNGTELGFESQLYHVSNGSETILGLTHSSCL